MAFSRYASLVCNADNGSFERREGGRKGEEESEQLVNRQTVDGMVLVKIASPGCCCDCLG